MATPSGIKYAVHLITTHFGDLVAVNKPKSFSLPHSVYAYNCKVCECLLRRGPLTLQATVRFTELTSSQVKNCLLVLIQHNCVQAFVLEQSVEHGDAAKVNTEYIALFDNIFHRWRFPKFLTIVSQNLDKQCIDLLEALLQHGRLTLKQMSDRAKSSQNEGNFFRIPCLLSISSIYTKVTLLLERRDDVILDSVQEAIIKLLNARFIERCPASEPVLTNPTKQELNARKRAAKSGKILEEQETLEQRVVEAAAPPEALRFLLLTQTEPAAEGKGETSSPTVTPGEKRKHDALESEYGATDEQVVLWRANFEEFIRRLRHKACIENVKTRLDDGAVTVLKAMLEATRSAEKKVKTENSGQLIFNMLAIYF
ncbi:hypothetical protein F3Y22_tig00109926pilonHSYRG00121 [Hibiscus syriacus]|uniref:DNA-directed RNA polymerase III subunit RPC3 n=1 Tax=Hibiscus syriacus TaxID=106335 RepID=A0A6A3BWB7_HIBSY|nr:hypothetical protein F3Y22_tig00109926pilonHSYRG00121 [Hibiscus syriacus]